MQNVPLYQKPSFIIPSADSVKETNSANNDKGISKHNYSVKQRELLPPMHRNDSFSMRSR